MSDPQVPQLQSAIERLSAQIADLDRRLRALEGSAAPPVPATPAPKEQIRQSDGDRSLKIINRIGAITLAIGVVFFFKYAVDSSWIGASGRVIVGVLAGLFQIVFAEWLRRRNQLVFSQGLAGCGLATLYISIYAASAYYFLLSAPVAFILLAAASILASPLSFLYGNPAIATLGLIGGLLTPPLLSDNKPHPWILFPYLLLLDVGSLAIAARRHWQVLRAVAFIGTAILFAAAVSPYNADRTAGLLFLPIFFALFFAASLRTLPWLAWMNVCWCLLCLWILLDQDHPFWFALTCFCLAAVHFAASRRQSVSVLRSVFYVIAHACLGIGALRLLALWGRYHSTLTTRVSVISELDSVFLALYAVVMIAVAVVRRSTIDRALGLTVIGIVVAKLYFYDVWRLDRFYRISAFVALGILLLAASFIYSRFRLRA